MSTVSFLASLPVNSMKPKYIIAKDKDAFLAAYAELDQLTLIDLVNKTFAKLPLSEKVKIIDAGFVQFCRTIPYFLKGMILLSKAKDMPETLERCMKIKNQMAASALKGRCANYSNCKNEKEVTAKCARCAKVVYCNKECQKTDWKNHKIVCKQNGKETT